MANQATASRGAGWRTHVIRTGAALIIIGALVMPIALVFAA